MTPKDAYLYSIVIRGQCSEYEAAIIQDPRYAYLYACDVLRSRWLLGEEVIAQDPKYAFLYAKYVIHGRFSEGEAAIATNAEWAYRYAVEILSSRFHKAESIILRSDCSEKYMRLFMELEKVDWREVGF